MSNDSTALNTEIVLSSIIDSLDDISVTANMKPMKPAKIELPFWNHFLAGGISGTVGAVITSPLEVVKTRFQSSAFKEASHGVSIKNPFKAIGFHISGTFSAVRSLYVNEGVFALWKGIGAMIFGVMPSRAIYFASYNKGKSVLSEISGEENSLVHLGAAFCAGITTATATNPIWLVKTRMQLQSVTKDSMPLYRNSLHCLTSVVKNEGVFALYKGLSASYLGVAEGTIQWVIYEKLKKKLKEYRAENSAFPRKKENGVEIKSSREWAEYFMVAATSKLIAAVITYPHEVLRTRLRQVNNNRAYNGLIATTKTILKEEGASALYSGMTAHLLRVVPNSAIMFFCYELIIHYFSAYNQNH